MLTIKALVAACALALATLLAVGTAGADPVVEGEEHCVINLPTSDSLNLRKGPGSNSERVGQLRYAQCGVQIIGPCQGSWCPVADGHYQGWAHRHYLAMVSPAMYCVSGVAAGDTLNLRAYPSAQSRVLAELDRHQCDIAFLPYSGGGWQKVRLAGWEGWVNRKFLSGE